MTDPARPLTPLARRQQYSFVAGEAVFRWSSVSVLNAWLALEIRMERGEPIASEFFDLPITAFDQTGQPLETHTWAEWHNLLMSDTYGPNWKQLIHDLVIREGYSH